MGMDNLILTVHCNTARFKHKYCGHENINVKANLCQKDCLPLLCPIIALISYFCSDQYETTARKSSASLL